VAPYGTGVRIDPGTAAIVPRAAGQFGATLAGSGEPFLQQRRVNQLSEHSLQATKEFADLTAWAEQNPDFKTLEPEYKKRVAEIQQAHRKEIKDPAVWRMFHDDFQRMSIRTGLKIEDIAREKEIGSHRADAKVRLDEYNNIITSAQDFDTAARAVTQARAYIAGLASSGTYTEEEAQALEHSFTHTAHVNFVKREIYEDPEATLERLEAGEYEGLDEADRTDLMETARSQAEADEK